MKLFVLIPLLIFINHCKSLEFDDCVVTIQENPLILEFKCTENKKRNAECIEIVKYHQRSEKFYTNTHISVNGMHDCNRPSM